MLFECLFRPTYVRRIGLVVVTAISWLGINHKTEKQKRKNKWTKWGIGGWGGGVGGRQIDKQKVRKDRRKGKRTNERRMTTDPSRICKKMSKKRIYRMTDRTDRPSNTQPDEERKILGLGARKRANKTELNYKQTKSQLSSYSNLNKMANNTTDKNRQPH